MANPKEDYSPEQFAPEANIHELGYERPDRMGFAGVVRILGWSAISLGGICLFRMARAMIEFTSVRQLWNSPRGVDKLGLLLEGGFLVVGVSLIRCGLHLKNFKSNAGMRVRRALWGFVLLIVFEFLFRFIEGFSPGFRLANLTLTGAWQYLSYLVTFGIYRAEETLPALILLAMLSTPGIKEITRETAPAPVRR